MRTLSLLAFLMITMQISQTAFATGCDDINDGPRDSNPQIIAPPPVINTDTTQQEV